MSEKIKVGFIGAGGIVGRHIEALKREPSVTIKGYFSPSQPHRPDEWGRKYPDADALLGDRVDVVFVCVPPSEHGLEKEIVEAGKPFFVEKPLGVDRSVPKEIGKLVVARNIPTAVGFQWRASPVTAEAKKQLQEVEVVAVTARYLDNALSYAPPWWLKQEKSGGQVIEQAAHVVDEARYLLGEFTVVSATEDFYKPKDMVQKRPELAESDISTTTSAQLLFANGVTGTLEASAIHEGSRQVEVMFTLVDESELIVARDIIIRKTGKKEDVLFRVAGDFTSVATTRQDQAFIEAVRMTSPTLVFASYPDALRTHAIVMDITEKARLARV